MKKKASTTLVGCLMGFAIVGSLLAGGGNQAHAAARGQRETYYGANLALMSKATGVNLDGTVNQNAPWPQYTNNYCFVAVVQALTNYANLKSGIAMHYPHQSDQGPATGNPDDEQPGQILYDMDKKMIPHDGPLPAQGSGINRRPFTLANTAYDFGGDPRSQSFGVDYEVPWRQKYHEHIYHNGNAAATLGMLRAVELYQAPAIALVNHAEHSVIIAGFWSKGNPLTDPDAQITSLAMFNPWDMHWGAYLSTANYEQISYNDWLNVNNLPAPWGGANTWFQRPYDINGNLDPDPSIGIYQAGAGTKNPNAHHWIGNFVVVQPDTHYEVSANCTYDENDRIMQAP